MVRETSVISYNTIRDSGLLSKRRWEVYDILYQHGPLTAHEIVAIARRTYPNANQTSFNARLSELETIDCVRRVGKKTNPTSGIENYLWDVTEKLPKKLTKPKTVPCTYCHGTGYVDAPPKQMGFKI